MERVTLGRTGLRASVMGLGCGGHSRLGLSQGKSEDEAVCVVRAALDLGINFIDTAETYKTEHVVGLALGCVPRQDVLISTKAHIGFEDRRSTAAEMRERVEGNLARLGTDYVDLFHLHGVQIDDYDYAVAELVPALLDLKTEGKIRFLGITEAFGSDPAHRCFVKAVQDDCWDVMMVGFNILNQSARERVLSVTQAKNIGTLCMFAVRRALSHPETLREVVAALVQQNLIDSDGLDLEDPLGFLEAKGVADSIQEAAYRFCRWEPGMDLVLSGSGNKQHLKENAQSLSRLGLPDEIVERLQKMFAGVDSIAGN